MITHYTRMFAITPHDSDVLTQPCLGLYVGSTGDVKVKLVGDESAVTIPSVPAGTILPVVPKLVYATGTTASGIFGLARN